MPSIYHLSDKDMKGETVSMSNFQGKILCFVNVASACGYTKSNYTQLSQLHDEFHGKGFEVLAFPCNQFGAQEPGTHDEICEFASKADFNGAKDKFVFFEKADVNGPDAREVYAFLKDSLPREDGSKDVGWNFEIFLVDQNGEPVKRFKQSRNPYELLKAELEKML